MILIPYRKIEIESPLSPGELVGKLLPTVAAHQPWFRSLVGEAEFVGEVNRDRISLMAVTKGTNTYQPVTKAIITPSDKGSVLHLTQTLHPVGAVVAFLFLGLLPFWLGGLLGLTILVLFHAVMCIVGFWPEARRIETRLRELTR